MPKYNVEYGIAAILADPTAYTNQPAPQWLLDHARVCLHRHSAVMHRAEIVDHPEWTDDDVARYRADIKRGKQYRRILQD